MTEGTAVRGPSALLAFRAVNVRSFRAPLELSLIATNIAEERVVRSVPWRDGGRPVSVLPVAGLFGANASGKSNVLKALNDMRRLVVTSFRLASPTGGLIRRPFVLASESATAPSRYEIDVVLDGVRHEYGFEVDDERVLKEWAFRYPHGRPALLFERHADLRVDTGPTARSASRATANLLRPNALFLSTAAAANHPVLLGLYEWFERNLLLAEAESRTARQVLTTEMLDDPHRREQVLALLRAADLGIVGAVKRTIDPVMRERMERALGILVGQEGDPENAEEVPPFEHLGVRLVHSGDDGEVALEADDESLGTRVWFGVVGPVVIALARGSVLLADEVDASLHPALVSQLIRLFQDPATNPRRAQLVFNSHDVTLLGDSTGPRLLGRDQIWFTERLHDGSTRLYPLSDLDPRREEAIGRRYLAGRYGATPILSDQEFDAVAESVAAGGRG